MLNYIDPGKDLKVFPAISSDSHEQMSFLRHDPEPHKPFEHELKAQRRREMFKEIRETLIAIGALALLIGWVML